MGQLHPPPSTLPVPALPAVYQFENPYIQKVKETPFLKSTVYSYEPSIYAQKPDIILSSLLNPRLNSTGFFPETQIITLIRCACEGLAFIQARGLRYGDVHIDNIYYDKSSKHFKLIHPHLLPASAYQLTRNGKRFSFLSPELLLALSEEQDALDDYTVYKSDVFALGVTLLEICSLRSSSDLYDGDTYNILDSKVQQRIASIKSAYSDQILGFITPMLIYDCNERPSATQLTKIINNSKM